jgi:N-acetyl-gamma-glutamyl-phosphate reductase
VKKIRAGIIGGAGYTGSELTRLLLHHPAVELVFVHSRSAAGKYVYQVHRDLLGETKLKFTADASTDVDVLFLCLGHGESKDYLLTHPVPETVRVIDLSQDFRLGEASRFVYGLSEWKKKEIATAQYIANPGCFATAIQLALLPLASNGLLRDEVHVSATTGSTGAGQSLTETSHFSWRNNNMSSYKAFTHQHLREIGRQLESCGSAGTGINFIPHRGNFSRGIHVSLYTRCSATAEECCSVFSAAYDSSPFVFVSDEPVDLKQVVNTNKCFLHLEKHGDKLLVTSVIDNLLKGASGQAVQNMNLMCGLEETSGLKLKAIAF